MLQQQGQQTMQRDQAQREFDAQQAANKPVKEERDPIKDFILKEESRLMLQQKYKVGPFAPEKGGKTTDQVSARQKIVNLVQDLNPDADPEEIASAVDEAFQGGMEGYDSYVKEHGPMKKKKPSQREQDTSVSKIVEGWQKSRYNSQLRQIREDNHLTAGTEQMGYREPPTYGGATLPPERDQALAAFMVDNPDMDQQEAANYMYAQDVADRLSEQYKVDDTEPVFNIQKLQQIAQSIGKPLQIRGIGGMTSIAELAALTAGGWTEAQLSNLLQQYSAVQSPVQKAYQGALNAGQ
jgi:peptidoglycan hydrolase-like protein with peptidoglycan-binding domain